MHVSRRKQCLLSTAPSPRQHETEEKGIYLFVALTHATISSFSNFYFFCILDKKKVCLSFFSAFQWIHLKTSTLRVFQHVLKPGVLVYVTKIF